jgi:diacylglycerol kinase (ATP)
VRVALFFNRNAGDRRAPHEIREACVRHGHELVAVIDDKGEVTRLLEKPCDLVAAAGGDGTVALVARTIARRGVPMAIIPLGTANNIALTLGIEPSMDQAIQRWDGRQTRSLDLGTARGPWRERVFAEAVGLGLIPAGIAHADSLPSEEARRFSSSLARTAHIYREALSRLEAHRCTIDVDGERFSDDFLLVEVLNIPFVGPNLVFAPKANPSDGFFSVALAQVHHQPQLDEYLRHRIEGTDCPLALTSRRGHRIEIEASCCIHVDDEVCQLEAGARVSLCVEAAAVEVLV